jgi:carotenoid cleavage dioxygenase
MMHDFAITENYTIFMDLPLTFRPERMQIGQPAFMFEKATPSRFGILPRHGEAGEIRWFETASCYSFHTLNAYESGDEVILIACRMNSTSVLSIGEDENDNDANVPYLHQWRFSLHTGEVKEKRLSDIACEFPRINENYTGRKNRYGYAGKSKLGDMPLFDGLVKFDLETGQTQIHSFETGCYGGEGVFVPRPDARTEDEGWVLTFVYNEGSGQSELIVVDALDFTAPPAARIITPGRVPYGFHGAWISGEQFS